MPDRSLLIGNFDGVHLGHQALLRAARLSTPAMDHRIIVLTFDPHPSRVLFPEKALTCLCSTEQKRELLLQFGADEVIAHPFDLAFSKKTPSEFAWDVIAPLDVQTVFVGEDFRFGYKRQGTVETLAALGKDVGFTVQSIPLTRVRDNVVSSSRIRQALIDGDLAYVSSALGHPFTPVSFKDRAAR